MTGQPTPLPVEVLLARTLSPLLELGRVQGGICASGDHVMVKPYAAKEPLTGRVLALQCKGCIDSRRPYAVPAVPALLALRLTPVSVRTGLRPYDPVTDAAALADEQWQHFENPAQALFAAQEGRCAGTGWPADTSAGNLTVDADPLTGLVLGLLCMGCRCQEGKPGQSVRRWRTYRKSPLGLRLPATRGLTRAFLTRSVAP